MEGKCKVRYDCPWGCCPHKGIKIFSIHCKVEGRGGYVFILNLREGKCCLTCWAPVDWHETPVNISLLNYISKDFKFSTLILPLHCQVRIVPISKNTQPYEVLLLYLNPLCGKLSARLPHLLWRIVPSYFFKHLVLNGHTMIIPARCEWGVISIECMELNGDVLQYLVQCLPKMYVPIGVGRSVVEYECLFALSFLKYLFVNINLFPPLEQFRFSFRESCPHGEICPWKVYCFFIVHSPSPESPIYIFNFWFSGSLLYPSSHVSLALSTSPAL